MLAGLRFFYLIRGEVRKSREIAEQRWRLAQRVSTPNVLMLAHLGFGDSLFFLGEVAAAHEQCLQALKLYQAQEYGINGISEDLRDIGVLLLARIAFTFRSLGYPDQAQRKLQECLLLAESQKNPLGLSLALSCGGWFHSDRGEWQQVRECAEEVIKLSAKHGFPYFLAYVTAMQGWALTEQGQGNEGIAQIQRGLASLQAAESELGRLDHFP